MQLSRPVLAHEELTVSDGMVVAQHPLGARIGVEVLERGGNAVDAAVTTAFAMGVLQPLMNGIGGGGNMVLHFADDDAASVYYSMPAPGLARPDMYKLAPAGGELEAAGSHFSRSFAWPEVKGNANTKGYGSIGVPGTVAGLALALERWGTMDLAQAMQPAIRLAEEGFPVGHHFTLASVADRATFQAYKGTAQVYYPGGQPIPVGGRFVQKDHARTLRIIAKKGPAGFYKGEIAEMIGDDCARNGGTLRAADLAHYRAHVMEPIRSRYRAHGLIAMPHLTAGTTVVEILNILEHFDLARIGWGRPEALHLVAEAIRLAAADRFTFMGDHQDAPLTELASKDYAASRAALISTRRAGEPLAGDPWRRAGQVRPRNFPKPAGAADDRGTTHITVVDRKRNAVSLTQTNYGYSGVVNPGVGVMMNNAMGWFCPLPGTINSVAPGKAGLNNMTPILILRAGRLKAAIGASGGRRIWTAVAQSIVNYLDFGLSLQEAVQAPRLHAETDDLLIDGRFGAKVKAALERKGHRVAVATPHFDRSPYSEPNGIAVAGTKLKSAVYPVAKPTYAAGYPGGDPAPAEADTLAPRPDLHP
ncbi:MAG: gamma-glutamyltransferase [Proteobacteria bacterium]|nr:gamma-glutamyltransferase [Pseudomonadota bacterium]MBI3496375.1 gamma-glutamyltransferase [Pseudomonadota bacterium]